VYYRYTMMAVAEWRSRQVLGWFGFMVNPKGLFKSKAKVLAGFVTSQTKLLWN
jgi:hypothetical protein